MNTSLQREISSKEDLGTCLVSSSPSLCSPPYSCRTGNGIINADGDLWKVQRKAGLQFLSNTNLKVLTDTALPKYLKITVKALQNSIDQPVVDLEQIFHELTTQIMGRMAYDVGFFSRELITLLKYFKMDIHNSDPFSQAFDYASGATGQRFQNPLWQVTEPFFGKQFRESVSVVKGFGSVIVSNAVKSRQNLVTTNATPSQSNPIKSFDAISGSLIYSLLDSINDKEMVADAALNYLSAGEHG
jgi:hypothetical protein